MMEPTTSEMDDERMVATPPAVLKDSRNEAPPSAETAAETPTGSSPETLKVKRRGDFDDSVSMQSANDDDDLDEVYIETPIRENDPAPSRTAFLSQMENQIPSPESIDDGDVSPLATPDIPQQPILEEKVNESDAYVTPHKPMKLSFTSERQEERPKLHADKYSMETVFTQNHPKAENEAINLMTGQTTIIHGLSSQDANNNNLPPYAMAPVESFASVPFDCKADVQQSMFPSREEDSEDDDEEEPLTPQKSSPHLVRTLFGWVEAKRERSPMKARVLSDRDVGIRKEPEIVVPNDEDVDEVEEQKRFLPATDSTGYSALLASKWFGTHANEEEPPHIDHVKESMMDMPEIDQNQKKTAQKSRSPANWSKICLYGGIIVVLLIIIAIASMLLAGKMNDDSIVSSEIQNAEGSGASDDDNLFPGGFFSTNNQFCTGAFPVDRFDVAYRGSNMNSNWDDNVDMCGDFMATGRSAWFVYEATGSQLMEASTCSENTTFDTKITVASGTNCEQLTCVTFNDQSCGDQSRAVWFAEAGQKYYINVHGFRDARGDFELTLQPIQHNDKCDFAEGPVSVGSTVFGTTSGSTLDMDQSQCGDVSLIQHPGVWYEIENTEGWIRAEAVSRHTGFIPQLSVYSGDSCSMLACEDGTSSGSLAFRALAGKTYYILVNGLNTADGDFDLSISWEFQDTCDFATPLAVSGPAFQATTESARLHDVPACGKGGFHTAPGMWFSVAGTGNMLAATTCGFGSDLDSHISVFRNGCNALQCVASTGQDLPCGTTGAVTWFSENESDYLIYVSGRGSRVGEFALKVSDSTTAAGEICPSAVAIGSGTTSVTGITAGAPLVNTACGNVQQTRGVWYAMEGSGSTMTLSTCDTDTTFDARVSIFTGSCGSLECEAVTSASCSELQGDPFQFTTVAGVNYYMLVHGPTPDTFGSFKLTLTEQSSSPTCASALPIASSPNTYLGTTIGVPDGRAIPCVDGETTMVGPKSVWYSIVGTGSDFSFSTCSEDTDFATSISVFSGACFNPDCVVSETVPCGRQQVVSFPTDDGEVYYVRVSSANADELGNFVLGVAVRSSFMGW